jgi:aspartate aminotransferase
MTMNWRLASRLDRIVPSITLAVASRAGEMKRRGVDVVSFGAGEPDFDTPEHIKVAARKALDGGAVSKYTDLRGTVDLREAVAAEMKKVHGVDYTVGEILISNGAKHSLFNAFLALLEPGDEVIIPTPYWVSYPDIVMLAGGNPVFVQTDPEDGLKMTAPAFAAAITPRTRAVILNSPSNPSGTVYERERLAAIAEVALAHDIALITDDIYRALVYGDARYVSVAALSPEIASRCVLIDGVSKAYAMTGWRIGYTAGPKKLIDAMAKLQGQSTTGAAHIAQVAATVAPTGPQECVEEMRLAFEQRRNEIVSRLRAIPDVVCAAPDGAFYAFPDLSAYVGRTTPGGERIADDTALCNYLLDSVQVAVVPGSGFGAPGFVRLSYACSMEDIRRGVDRIAKALAALG